MPKVSVIVPNYNHAPYLERRLDSILGQTYQDLEVILLDDCSTDNSAEFLHRYQDNPKVSHVVVNEHNSGSTFKQWERGFALAQGEYIWIAESDDWCEKNLLETLVPALETDPTVTLSFCQCQLIDDSGKKLYRTTLKATDEPVSGRDFVTRYMFGDMVIVNAGMAVFRKSALVNIDQEYTTMRAVGDWRFWIEIALKGKVNISGELLAYCFRHSGTVTSASVATGNDIAEGNRVFEAVLLKCQPTANEIENALKQRIRIYLEQIPLYQSKAVQREAKRKVLSLHPSTKFLYYQILIKKCLSR